jgi:hypothetical protein
VFRLMLKGSGSCQTLLLKTFVDCSNGKDVQGSVNDCC